MNASNSWQETGQVDRHDRQTDSMETGQVGGVVGGAWVRTRVVLTLFLVSP